MSLFAGTPRRPLRSGRFASKTTPGMTARPGTTERAHRDRRVRPRTPPILRARAPQPHAHTPARRRSPAADGDAHRGS
eukprot:3448485-Prymnesium_polylepis.2